ncbi:2256_t:CDS:2, partial [Dentiscutata erythropus]
SLATPGIHYLQINNLVKHSDLFVKTAPLKKSNSVNILKSCPIKGQIVYPNDSVYKQDITDSEIQSVFDTIKELGSTLTDDITFDMLLDSSTLELQGVYQGTKENAQKDMEKFISLTKPTSKNFYEESLFKSV